MKIKATVNIAVDDSYTDPAETKWKRRSGSSLLFEAIKLNWRSCCTGQKISVEGKLISRIYEPEDEKRTTINTKSSHTLHEI